jgi:hypothetical protein
MRAILIFRGIEMTPKAMETVVLIQVLNYMNHIVDLHNILVKSTNQQCIPPLQVWATK